MHYVNDKYKNKKYILQNYFFIIVHVYTWILVNAHAPAKVILYVYVNKYILVLLDM